MNPVLPSVSAAPIAENALHLMDAYTCEDVLFASPTTTLLGRGVFERITPVAQHGLNADVQALFDRARRAGHDHPVIVGAVPFDTALPAQLIVPDQLSRAAGLGVQTRTLPRRSLGMDGCTPQPVPAPQRYCQGVEEALVRFARGELEKVVLSRTLDVEAKTDIDINALLTNLLRHNPHGYTFAIPLDTPTAAPHVFAGASPELLVRRVGRQVIVNPLAGSAARSDDADEDRRRATALLASAKDRHEHAVVINAVIAALHPLCTALNVPDGPELTSTDTLWHLSTTLVGELKDPATTALDLALALHPTPAVCGHPTAAAFTAISAIEPFPRGFFTGMVGWCDAQGDGEWAVAIRCAEIERRRLRLFAGAGIVAGSTPEKELAETGTKLRTMLNAMGIAGDAGQHDTSTQNQAPETA